MKTVFDVATMYALACDIEPEATVVYPLEVKKDTPLQIIDELSNEVKRTCSRVSKIAQTIFDTANLVEKMDEDACAMLSKLTTLFKINQLNSNYAEQMSANTGGTATVTEVKENPYKPVVKAQEIQNWGTVGEYVSFVNQSIHQGTYTDFDDYANKNADVLKSVVSSMKEQNKSPEFMEKVLKSCASEIVKKSTGYSQYEAELRYLNTQLKFEPGTAALEERLSLFNYEQGLFMEHEKERIKYHLRNLI